VTPSVKLLAWCVKVAFSLMYLPTNWARAEITGKVKALKFWEIFGVPNGILPILRPSDN
jgi:hypothetical protein